MTEQLARMSYEGICFDYSTCEYCVIYIKSR